MQLAKKNSPVPDKRETLVGILDSNNISVITYGYN